MKILYSLLLLLSALFFCSVEAKEVASSSKSQTASAIHESRSLPATIPVKRTDESDNPNFSLSTKILIVSCLVISMCGIFLYSKKSDRSSLLSLRRTNKIGNREALKLSKQIALTGKHSLHLVTWGDEDLLLGCADQTITLIDRRKHLSEPNQNDLEESSKIV